MPYKRRLRLLWVAFDHPEWVQEAWAAALPLAPGRIEQRCCCGPQGLEWADLIITLDNSAEAGLPPLPSRVQRRHVDLAAAADAAARRCLVEARVAGIVGGLRLFDRLESLGRKGAQENGG